MQMELMIAEDRLTDEKVSWNDILQSFMLPVI